MKVLACVLCMLLAAGSAIADPAIFSGIGTPVGQQPSGREACWSEPMDCGDSKISSEIIGAVGLESELANDFVIATDATITKAIGFGGYFTWLQGDPPISSLNWKFYDDGGCLPSNLLTVYSGLGTETFVCYDGFGYPTYKYEMATAFDVVGLSIYWLGLQAADHVFPPQWGREGTGSIVTNCETMFKSAFFGFPDWTPANRVIGVPWDAAQEFECGQPTATQATSWGGIRGLYR